MIQGQKIEITGTFRDVNNALVDPTNVFFRYKTSGSIVQLQYGVDGALTRESLGIFKVVIDTTPFFGTLLYRWLSTGNGQTTQSPISVDVEKAEP